MFSIATAVGVAALLFLVAIYYIQALRYDGPPTVFPSLPFIGDAYHLLYRQTHYFSDCRARYGPIFRCLAGPQRIVVVCDPVGIQSIFRDKLRVLSSASNYNSVCSSVGSVDANMSHYLPDRILPLTSDLFSPSRLVHFSPALNRSLKAYIDDIERAAYNPQYTSLSQFIGQTLYAATSIGVFGESFPVSTYDDFEMVDIHFFDLMTRLPLISLPAKRARDRLRVAVGEYIEAAGPTYGEGVLPEPTSRLLGILCDLGLKKKDRDSMLFLFMWGVHSSQIRAAFWLFAYLLNDPPALMRLRDSIDAAVTEKYQGNINALIDAPSGSLDGPEFELLGSAVKEALRVSSTIAPLREVCEDTVVTLSTGETYPLRKGEFVAPAISVVHQEDALFEDAGTFVLERFTREYTKEKEAKENGMKKGTYLPWGGGVHICKGRHLSQHAIKMFVVLTLRTLDITAVDSKTHKALSAGFIPNTLTYTQRWKMIPGAPMQVCIRKRDGDEEVLTDED